MIVDRDLPAILNAIQQGRVIWKKHTLERMLERGISRATVKQAILAGQVIESYPDDYPVPSCLICALEPEPIHVVVVWDAGAGDCHVITAYRPDRMHFEPGFLRRRKE